MSYAVFNQLPTVNVESAGSVYSADSLVEQLSTIVHQVNFLPR